MSSGKRERTTSQPAQQPAKPKSDAAKSPRRSKTRVAIFVPVLLILLCIVLIILIAPLSASLLVDDDDATTGNSAGAGNNAGRIPARIFKLVPFFFLVQSDNPINRIQYYYGATNSCAYQLTTAAGKNATGTAICGKTGVVKFLTAKEGAGSVTAAGSLVKFDDYYRRRVAATTSVLLSIECLIVTVILAISLYSLYADYRSSSAQRAKDAASSAVAAGGSRTAYSDAKKAAVAADDKAHRVAKWTEGWPIISAHVVGIIFLVVCIAVIAAGSEQQVPAGMSASPAWGLGLVILAGVLHVTCVMTPLIVVAMRKRRAKASKSKSKGDA